MEEMAFELCRQLVIPYTPSGFDPSLVSRELLCYTLGHREPDCREISLYVLDDYLSVTGQSEERVFSEAPEHLQTELFRESARRFHWGSRLASKLSASFLGEHEEDEPQPTYDVSTWLPWSEQPETETILVVHGTWAKGKWWLPGSPFIDYLDSVSNNAVYKQPDQFQWTGNNSHSHRLQAGNMLAKWLIKHPYVTTIVAHSHGGNVAIVASKDLLYGERVINKLVLLGTPSRSDYPPVLRTIGILSNVYSFVDLVQTPTGTFPHRRGEGRTISDSRHTLNIIAGNGKLGPGHSDLHEPWAWKANRLDRLL